MRVEKLFNLTSPVCPAAYSAAAAGGGNVRVLEEEAGPNFENCFGLLEEEERVASICTLKPE